MSSKYGVPLTDEQWAGLPLRAGNFERTGKLDGLVAAGDALLVWGCGVSDVTLHARRGARTERHRFRRRSGMLDLLPRGTVRVVEHGPRCSAPRQFPQIDDGCGPGQPTVRAIERPDPRT